MQGVFLCIQGKNVEISLPILVIKKDCHPVVATLGDVVRVTRRYDAGDSWHVGMIRQREVQCKTIWGVSLILFGECPLFSLFLHRRKT